jgi:hypothetical protein
MEKSSLQLTLLFHVQQAMGQYTMVTQMKEKMIDGKILPRSKEPPTTIWTVVQANIIW